MDVIHIMKEYNILFIADHLHGGGAEQIMLDVANNLAKKYCVSIALLDSTNNKMHISSKVNQINIDVNKGFINGHLWKRGKRKLSNDEISTIKNLITNINPDLIILTHAHAFFTAPFIEHNNIWFWIHGEIFNPYHKKTKNLFRWYKEKRRVYFEIKSFKKLMNNQKLIYVNEYIKDVCQNYIPDSQYKIIYNGIDYNRLIKNIEPLPTKKWDCIFVGRLSKEKQACHVIRAFANSNLNGRLAIVGDGDQLGTLIQLAKELNIFQRVDFLGWKTDVANYIQQSKILLLTSLNEGCPLIVAESILLNVPVIAYACSTGIIHQLSSNELITGLVTPQDINLLTEKINQIHHTPYKIKPEDKERLCIEKMIVEFEKLLPQN